MRKKYRELYEAAQEVLKWYDADREQFDRAAAALRKEEGATVMVSARGLLIGGLLCNQLKEAVGAISK